MNASTADKLKRQDQRNEAQFAPAIAAAQQPAVERIDVAEETQSEKDIRNAIVRCGECRWGRDVSMGATDRRCRRLPPQAHFIRMFNSGFAIPYGQAMWPIVQPMDYCAKGERYEP